MALLTKFSTTFYPVKMTAEQNPASFCPEPILMQLSNIFFLWVSIFEIVKLDPKKVSVFEQFADIAAPCFPKISEIALFIYPTTISPDQLTKAPYQW